MSSIAMEDETLRTACLKMISSTSSASSSATPVSLSSNGHCSINQGGLGPVMEIREIASYCNNCVGAEKYYHHPGTPPIVHANAGRHSAVYHPQVFYTPPPTAYPSNSGAAPPAEWSCPPNSTDSFSHFIYPHHPQYPPQPPQHHHPHDYSNFLGIPSSCYETDIIMMGAPPPPQVGNTCDPSHLPPPTLAGSFMFPPAAFETPTLPLVTAQPQKLPSDTSSTSANDDSDDIGEDDDDRQVISIEDDDNTGASMESDSSSWCALCKKPATITISNATSAHHCSSPQLAKILENIDDDELDISVCSGDIEIGGIEDEMMQAEQISFRITFPRLAQLIGVSLTQLVSTNPHDFDQLVALCSKCQKLVVMAESLEKQLSSVLCNLRQIVGFEEEHQDGSQSKPLSLSTTSTQTDNPKSPDTTNLRTISIVKDTCSLFSSVISEARPEIDPNRIDYSPSKADAFLCHGCGRTFNCGRNLGKHIRRHHYKEGNEMLHKLQCSREDCLTTCSDNTALQTHMQVHTGDKPYFCGACLKLFSTKSNLTAHVNSGSCKGDQPTKNPEHDSSQKRIRCEKCGLQFRNEVRFKKHTQSLGGVCSPSKLFPCDICKKLFVKASELRAHVVIHNGKRSFPCDICGVSFTTKGNQIVHQRTHFDKKRFKCHHCDKSFTRNLSLQQHINNLHDKDTAK